MPNTPIFKPNLPLNIAIIGFDNAQLLDVAGPLQVFATANEFCGNNMSPYYRPFIIAEKDSFCTTSGVTLQALGVDHVDVVLDTIIISGGRGINALCQNTKMLDFIEMQASKVRRAASVCSGAFALAKLGLLDGINATTHWQRCNELQKQYPNLHVQKDAIFLNQNHIWTSAGITSGIDMALAMVENDFGVDVAKKVARQLVVYLRRPGGQTQFSTMLELYSKDNRFNELAAWIQSNLRQDLSIDALAAQVGMSSRNFTRLYKKTTGYAPSKAVLMIRLDTAKNLLEFGKSIKETARLCGFKNIETMRLSFIRHIGISPQQYKTTIVL